MTIDLTDFSPPGPIPLSEATLWLTPQDTVAVALSALRPGTVVGAEKSIRVEIG